MTAIRASGIALEASDRLLRLGEVLDRVGLSKTVWYRLVKDGRAPTPLKPSTRLARWRESDINAWIRSLGE